jgi:hypothetical protein
MSVHDKIREGAYEPEISYPRRKDYEVVTYVTTNLGNSKEIKEFDRESFTRDCAEARESSATALDRFKIDLFDECGVLQNPKAQAAYDIAWEDRHANGLLEVAYFFEELVELIK